MKSQVQEAKFIDGRGYYNNRLVFTTADSRRLIQQLMKGIWREDFVSPVEQELAIGKGFKVLDVGCGFGDWILQLSKDYPLANYVGLDLFPIFPKDLPQKNLQFVQGDILKGLPFEDDTFDFIHMRLLLMLFTPVQLEEIVIKELLRVCKPGGWIEIADFDLDGKSMGPVYKRLLTFSIKYLETKGVNSLISEELPELIENTNQVEEVYTDEAYTPIGNWGGKTGVLAAEVFSSIINDIGNLGISDEEKEIMTDQFVEELNYYKTYIISERFFCQKKALYPF